jgi:hypothetical protein
MAVKYLYQHLQMQYPPKFTQIGIWFENMPSGNPGVDHRSRQKNMLRHSHHATIYRINRLRTSQTWLEN